MNLLSFLNPLKITKLNSTLNGEIKVIERFGKRTLFVNDAEQSGGTITGMWENSLGSINNHQLAINNCLILGLGGGTVISLLNKYYPLIKITAIEFDLAIIDVAEKYFGIKTSASLSIIQADAFLWIREAKKKYDLVIFDLYLGKFNPEKSRELAFLKKLKALLSPNGFILFNAHYQNDEENYQKLLTICRKIYLKVELVLSRPFSRILFLGN